jgi:hypothetical protein
MVDEELARAVRHEAVTAICHHWRVTPGVVWRWRKALGIGRTDPEGSRRLIQAAATAGAEVMLQYEYTAEERQQRRQRALELNLARHLETGYHGPWWTAEDIALLGRLTDHEVAKRVERTRDAVRQKREELGLPNPRREGQA